MTQFVIAIKWGTIGRTCFAKSSINFTRSPADHLFIVYTWQNVLLCVGLDCEGDQFQLSEILLEVKSKGLPLF